MNNYTLNEILNIKTYNNNTNNKNNNNWLPISQTQYVNNNCGGNHIEDVKHVKMRGETENECFKRYTWFVDCLLDYVHKTKHFFPITYISSF